MNLNCLRSASNRTLPFWALTLPLLSVLFPILVPDRKDSYANLKTEWAQGYEILSWILAARIATKGPFSTLDYSLTKILFSGLRREIKVKLIGYEFGTIVLVCIISYEFKIQVTSIPCGY